MSPELARPELRVRTRTRITLEERLARCVGGVEHKPVDSLTAYRGNPRKHPEKQLAKLEASIREFGFLAPVLATRSGEIIVGEARVMAARRVGLPSVPVICVDHLSAGQVRAYRLADNKLAEGALWDAEALSIEFEAILISDFSNISVMGWEEGEITLLGGELGGGGKRRKEPAVKMPSKNPVSRLGDLWLLGDHRVVCASPSDPMVWERLMDGRAAAMCLSDPRFDVLLEDEELGAAAVDDGHGPSADGDDERAIACFASVLDAMVGPLVEGGVVALLARWQRQFAVQAAARRLGLRQIDLCVWSGAKGQEGDLYRSQHELVVMLRKGDSRVTDAGASSGRRSMRPNVWDHPCAKAPRGRDAGVWPSVKPVGLVADAIMDVTGVGEIVIDGFLGWGTTLLAAEETERLCFGVEPVAGFVDVAIERWQEFTGRTARLSGSGQTFAEVRAARGGKGEAIGV